MSKRPARRVLKAITAALLLVPLFAGLAPSAEADDRVGRNNFCRASGHSTVTCNFVDDDDADKDGDKKEIFTIDIVVKDINVDVDISKVLVLENVFLYTVIGAVNICSFNYMDDSACVGLITLDVSNVLNKNLIGWNKTCAKKDGKSSCRSS